jgi:hypothetical protein
MSQRNIASPSRSIDENPNPSNLSCSHCSYALYPVTGRCTNGECPRHRRKGGGVMTADQLLREYAPPSLFHGRKWGDWTFDSERLCLVFRAAPQPRGEGSDVTVGVPLYTGFFGTYEIDLERVRDSAALLDWIFQIQKKLWASARVVKDLLNAFDSIFDPQANLCSGACGAGSGGRVIKNPGEFLQKRIATVGNTDGSLKDAV